MEVVSDERVGQLVQEQSVVQVGRRDVTNYDLFALLQPRTASLQLLLNYDQHFLQEELEEIIRNKVKVTVYDQSRQPVSKEVLQLNRLIQVQGVSPQEEYYLNIKIKLGNYVIDRDYSFQKGELRKTVLIERQAPSEQHKGSLSSTLFISASSTQIQVHV